MRPGLFIPILLYQGSTTIKLHGPAVSTELSPLEIDQATPITALCLKTQLRLKHSYSCAAPKYYELVEYFITTT